jgi:hypothetical protein
MGMSFKKKGKPGKGGHKKYKKKDLFTVKRYHARKGLGKTMRPLFSGDHYQLRLAQADKQLQTQTLPPLRRTTWTPGSDGVNGHMVVDPRRRRAHIFARRLRRLLSKHDEYLHPDLVKQGKKHKKYIPLIDLTDTEEEPEEVTKEEPEPEDMSPLDLLREVLRWRSLIKQKKQREPAEDMSPLDLLREVLRWRNLKKQKKPREPGDDPEGRQ